MMRRYAVYVAPDGPFGDRGAVWLGWDMASGQPVAQPDIDGLDIAALTKRPRRYGFHATIKPPMALAQGATPEALTRAARDLAERSGPVTLDALAVTRIGSFLALTPVGDVAQLNDLAATVVRALDPFRAPLSPENLIRRRKRPLTVSQERNLTRWGYPNVMEDFRFHMTLTGPLKDPQTVAPIVAVHFAPVLPTPFVIDHLTIAGEDAVGMFHTIARLPLGR